jgi:hypothetical protein
LKKLAPHAPHVDLPRSFPLAFPAASAQPDEHWAPIHRQLSEGGSSGCHAWLLELLARAARVWPFSQLAPTFLLAASGLLEASVAAGAAQPPSQQGGQGSGEAAAALRTVGQGLARVLAGWCLAAGVGPPVVMPRAVRVAAAVAAARRTHAETPCLGCSSCLASLGSLVLAARHVMAAARQAGGPAAGRAQLVRLLPLLSPLVGQALGRQAGVARGADASGAEHALALGFIRLLAAGMLHCGECGMGLGPLSATVGLLASCGALEALAAALGTAGRIAHEKGGSTVSGGGGGNGPGGPAGALACVFGAQQVAAGPPADRPHLQPVALAATTLANIFHAIDVVRLNAGSRAGQAAAAAGQAAGGGPGGGGCEPAAAALDLGAALALLVVRSGALDALVGTAYGAPPGDGPDASMGVALARKEVGARGVGGGGTLQLPAGGQVWAACGRQVL